MDNTRAANPTKTAVPDTKPVSLREIIGLVTQKWYWFAISLFVSLFVAFIYTSTRKPVYKRVATILIKETNVRRSNSGDIETLLSQQTQMTSKLANEVVSFQSPALMSEAVRRLGLETEYAIEGRSHDHVVYGAGVPVSVDFSDMNPGVSLSMKIHPGSDSTITISGISGSMAGHRFSVDRSLSGKIGDVFETPAGTFVVRANPYWTSNSEWKRNLLVSHSLNGTATRTFLPKLSVSPEDLKNRSDVLRLSVSDYNTARAEDLLKMLITVYNENWVEDMNKTAISTSMFIKDRLANIEVELSNVDETISKFKSTNLMPDVSQMSTAYIQQSSELTRQVRQLENQLSIVKYLRNYLTNNIGADDLIPLPSGAGEGGLSTQVTEYNKLVLQRNGIITNSSRNNPIVIDIDRSLSSMRTAITASIDNQINQIGAQMAILSKQEAQNASRIAENPNQAKALLSFERQQKVKETLYLFLLQKREENELSQAFTPYNTRVITPPYGSNVPVSPNTSRIMFIAFILGLALPSGLLYVSQIANSRVRGRKDLEGLPYPFLGEVPQKHSKGERVDIFTNLVIPAQKNRGDVEIVVKAGSRDIINEAFRVLRTNLEFMCKQSDHNVMIVTSFNPSSGKTFVTINLALALALKQSRVLLVDGDFRRYSLTRTFGLSKYKGFSDFLSGNDTSIDKYIVPNDEYKGLDILPVGTVPPNPSELLASSKFAETIAKLKAKYDYVFIDCAPVDIVADTQIMAPVAERTLFVVRAGLLEREMLKDCISMGEEGKYNSLTLVLNGTDMDSAYGSRYGSRYAYYYGRYGHNYGYGYGHGSKAGLYSYDADNIPEK